MIISISIEQYIDEIKSMPYNKSNDTEVMHTHQDYLRKAAEAAHDLSQCTMNTLSRLTGGKLDGMLGYDGIDYEESDGELARMIDEVKTDVEWGKPDTVSNMRKSFGNSCDMLQGCYNRIHVTDNIKELGDMYKSGLHRIAETVAIAEELQGIRKMARVPVRSYSPDLEMVGEDNDYQLD